MLTRGKRRAVPGTTTQKSTAKGASSKRSGPHASKWARTVQNNAGRSHPSQLERQPFAAQAPVPGTSQASSMSSAAVIPALTKAISNAVIQGLTKAGFISNSSVNSGDGAATTIPIVSVQDSVADVVEDLTGEGHDNLNPTSLNTLGSLDTNTRPQQVQKLISVPLVSRVSEKIQAVYLGKNPGEKSVLAGIPPRKKLFSRILARIPPGSKILIAFAART